MDPMIWEDIEYEDEMINPDGTKREPDKVDINYNLKSHYQKLISIRKNHDALSLGSYKTILADDENDIFIFERKYNGQKFYIALNNSLSKKEIEISVDSEQTHLDLLNDAELAPNNGKLKISLEYKWGAILLAPEQK